MPVVTFLPSYRKVEVPTGTTILDAARKAGLQMNVVCGGVGKCGKCLVYVKAGKAEFDRQKYGRFFTPAELGRGACLACTTTVVSDLDVTVPEGSLIQEQKILIEGLDLTTAFRPSVLKYHVTLSAPTLEDPSPDLNRMLDAIHRQHGPLPEKIFAPLGVLRKIPEILRAADWDVTATVGLQPPGKYWLLNVEAGDTSDRLYGTSIDLGTTTVVAYIWDLVSGKVAGIASNYNRQISCGEDILSRVNFGRKSGLPKLQTLAAESINTAITNAANQAKIDRDDIYEVMVAGNTVMTHMLLGIDPAYIISEPYVPVVRRSINTAASNLGLSVAPTAGVFAFPAVSDFIGGDIVADVLACGMGTSDEVSLMIDIGTNFEVVLGNNEWMFSCAGAAGPALEGGEVLFGMRANPGAIERVTIDPTTLEPQWKTINDIKPKGICGSGLIDLLAELLTSCVIDRNGLIDTTIDHPRIRKGEYAPEYVVAFADQTGIGKDLVVTENDIKSLIMSKASVLAACAVLMNVAGIAHTDLGTIYFSGGFGNYINKQNAITIGLTPEVPLDRIKNIGNGAVNGANIALINRDERRTLDVIADNIAYIELNAEPSFMEEYTSSSFLPHTDLERFPGVLALLDRCRLRAHTNGIRHTEA